MSNSNARAARQMLRSHRYGALSTLSKRFNGHPFGSVIPYLTDHDGSLLILISELAEHTKNIRHDPRVSLIIYGNDGLNVQSQARVTLMGAAQPAVDKQQIAVRYLRYFPESQSYLAMSDFSFYRIVPQTLRYIGGFSEIHWVSADSYLIPSYPLVEQEDDIIAHMNTDHRDTMRRYCRHVHRSETLNVEMLGIDCDGFDVRADDAILRFDFEEMVRDAQQARQALVKMARSTG